jgi:methylthioribose-1-phosphate isomerase
LPFYVACPISTIDVTTPTGADIPIEHRSAEEILGYRDTRWAPMGIGAVNPVFDVTPADLITALITERGVVQAPNAEKIAALVSGYSS